MTSSIKLKRDQSQERLTEMYDEEDLYWYLRSQSFCDLFLDPMGKLISELGNSCLDVGCGEGQLSQFVDCDYYGIDASESAIKAAKKWFPLRDFEVARLEEYEHSRLADVVVFGGILQVLVERESHVSLLEKYIESCDANYVIVFDLQRFDSSHLQNRFNLVRGWYARANIEGELQEVKRNRKVEVYKI